MIRRRMPAEAAILKSPVYVHFLAFTPDGAAFVLSPPSAGAAAIVRRERPQGHRLVRFRGASGGIAMLPNGRFVATWNGGYVDPALGRIRAGVGIYAPDGAEIARFERPDLEGLALLGASEDGRRVAAWNDFEPYRVLIFETASLVSPVLELRAGRHVRWDGVGFVPGTGAFALLEDGRLVLYDLETGKRTPAVGRDPRAEPAFVARRREGTVTVHAASGQEVCSLPPNLVDVAVLTPDRRFVIAAAGSPERRFDPKHAGRAFIVSVAPPDPAMRSGFVAAFDARDASLLGWVPRPSRPADALAVLPGDVVATGSAATLELTPWSALVGSV